MTETALIEKLRKVLALTTSPEEGEAAAASATLARLLTEHNLDIADLEQKGAKSAPAAVEAGHDLGKAAFKWKLDLAESIAAHYYCAPLVNRQRKTVSFVGRPDNVESLRLLYGWLIDQIARIAREERRKPDNAHIDPLRWQVGFGEGAVIRLSERLDGRRQAEESSTTCVALVRHHAAEVSDYLEARYGYRMDGRRTAQEEVWAREWDQRRARLAELKLTDIEAYYRECPRERPLTPEQLAENDRLGEIDRKREERNARRRTGRYRYSYLSLEEERKAEQHHVAQRAGHASADRINLEPFLTGGTTSRGELDE